MKRFLSTTAILMTLTGTAFADSYTAKVGSVEMQQSDFFASDLIGMRIYNSETEVDATTPYTAGAEQEWDDIGEINDIIIAENGDVRAVILGVGGFLGIGERDVTVSMDDIRVLTEDGDSNDRFLVVSTSKAALENAPVFERALDDTEKAVDSAAVKTEDAVETAAIKTEDAVETAEVKAENLTNTMQRPMLLRPTIEREGYAELETAEIKQLSTDMLDGASVYGVKDEMVGEIDSLLLSGDGQVESAVINVGGFLGLGEKPVEVTFDELQILRNVDDGDLRVYIESSEEKLEAQPEYQS